MMEQDYLIAGHRIRVEGDRLVRAVEAMPGFSVFKTETTGEPVCRFMATEDTKVPEAENTEMPEAENTKVSEAATLRMPEIQKELYRDEIDGIVSRFGLYAGGYAFTMTPPDGGRLGLWMEKDARTACFAGNLAPRLLRFACWMAYGVATVPLQTVAVHTSTIRYKGRAVLFLGESGTGKSTHTRLWRENIEGAALLNDDSPVLRIIDGKPWVYGSPWSGKTPCYKNERYPLAACVRLSQAPENRISRQGVVQGYGALHPSCPPCFAYDEALYDGISSVLNALLSAVPVYHLECLPDAEAARLSCRTVFDGEATGG